LALKKFGPKHRLKVLKVFFTQENGKNTSWIV
jgi:hypothetical protein